MHLVFCDELSYCLTEELKATVGVTSVLLSSLCLLVAVRVYIINTFNDSL